MKKLDYEEKKSGMLSDTDTYNKLAKDPTETLQNKVNKLIIENGSRKI